MEEIAVRHQAQALVPGLVRRGEVLLADFTADDLLDRLEERLLELFGPGAGRLVALLLLLEVAEPDPLEGLAVADLGTEPLRLLVDVGVDGDVRGRPLDHRDLLGRLRQRGDERDRRRSGADDGNPLPGAVDTLGPGLRVDHRAPELVGAGELRSVAAVVVVVARREVEERTGPGLGALAGVDLERPSARPARPVGPTDRAVQPDVRGEVVVGDRLVEVVEDRCSGGDRLLVGPRLEGVPQRVHVAVGADARIAEQAPRPTQLLPLLEHDEGTFGVVGLQLHRRGDARQARPHDHDVQVIRVGIHGISFSGRPRMAACRLENM